MFEVVPLLVATDDVVGAVRLIGRDEVWIVDRRAWLHRLHVTHQLLLKANVQYLRTLHCIGQVQRRYVPACVTDTIPDADLTAHSSAGSTTLFSLP